MPSALDFLWRNGQFCIKISRLWFREIKNRNIKERKRTERKKTQINNTNRERGIEGSLEGYISKRKLKSEEENNARRHSKQDRDMKMGGNTETVRQMEEGRKQNKSKS